jgi:U3 small nucleolar RNA-associated protein 25
MSLQSHTLIYIPSYFDYVRVRNLLKEEEISFCSCADYSSASDISRARSWFFHGERQVMLYTERFHFYRRYMIRGIKNIIFYGVPQYPEFYSEIVNLVDKSEGSVLVYFMNPFDYLPLQRILGFNRCKRILHSPNSVHLLISR